MTKSNSLPTHSDVEDYFGAVFDEAFCVSEDYTTVRLNDGSVDKKRYNLYKSRTVKPFVEAIEALITSNQKALLLRLLEEKKIIPTPKTFEVVVNGFGETELRDGMEYIKAVPTELIEKELEELKSNPTGGLL